MRPGLLALPLKWGITVRGARGSLHFGQSAPSSSWYIWTGTCTHGAERRDTWPSQEQLKAPLLQVQCFAHGWRVAQVCSPRLCWGTLLKPKQVLFLQGQKLVGYLPKASRRSCWRIAPTKNLMSWGMKSRRKKDGKRQWILTCLPCTSNDSSRFKEKQASFISHFSSHSWSQVLLSVRFGYWS